MRKVIILFGLLIVLAGCGLRSSYWGRWGWGRWGTAWGGGAFASNGERIYFTSTSARSGRITYRGGPAPRGMMMGGILTCASCHGPSGEGGRHIMHNMQVMDAPDIRWSALAHEGEEEHGGEYSLEAFRLAVIDGRHPDGEPLDPDMPRWNMSDGDLTDLADYLQSLP